MGLTRVLGPAMLQPSRTRFYPSLHMRYAIGELHRSY